MKEQKKTFLNNTHFVILIPVLVCILALAIALFIKPAEVSTAIEAFKSNALNALTPFYLWLGLGVVAFCVFIAFSKYGNVRLGAEKPEFGLFPWIAMMFCAGMGSSLMYWAAAEWISYLSAPPMGAEPFSQQAQELAMVYGSYHWGITPWALYIVGAIALGIRYYIHKKPELSLSACCAAVIGEKRVNTLTGRIIDIIFILGLLAGQACTLYFGTPMICEILHRLFGIERSFGMTIVVMCVVTMIFTGQRSCSLARPTSAAIWRPAARPVCTPACAPTAPTWMWTWPNMWTSSGRAPRWMWTAPAGIWTTGI